MNANIDTKSTDRPLAGVSVLVTRPSNQAENLCRIIENAGGKAIRFPVMEIIPIDDLQSVKHIIEQLDTYDIAIFISANAVNHAVRVVKEKRGFPEGLKLAAIGKATKKALEDASLRADIYPSQQFDSEALLALPQMQQICGKRILIFRGKGGRELLKNTLVERGAQVDYAELYQRTMPDIEPDNFDLNLQKNAVDIVTVTSNQGLDNLFALAGNSGRKKLVKTPIVVISERMVENAMKKGIQADIIIAEQVNDLSILDAIQKWRLENIQE